MTWSVGQKVYVVPTRRNADPYYSVVSKVGRKWVTCARANGREDGRFNTEGFFDGGGYTCPARAWATKEEHDAYVAKETAWHELRMVFRNHWGRAPAGVVPMTIKSVEAVSGCFSKAAPHEPLFVLRAQDRLAPGLVREWAKMAALNGCPEGKINEALALADAMEAWPNRKYPD